MINPLKLALKANKGLLKFVPNVLLSIILTISMSAGNAKAFFTEDIVISGSSHDFTETLKKIDDFIPVIKDEEINKLTQTQQEFIEKPQITQTKTREELDAEKKKQESTNSRNVIARERTVPNKTNTIEEISSDSSGNSYFYGFCTWYAASKRPEIPNNWGNGGRWLSSAKSIGWPTGSDPVPGAILVTSESWVGHVAYVESVDGDNFSISEMNFRGWSRVSTRTLSVNDSIIKGFIY